MAPPLPFSTAPLKCYRITSFSRLFLSLKCNFCNTISLPRKLTRNVHHLCGNSLSPPFSGQSSSVHRNLYSRRQTGISLIAFHAKNSESRGRDDQALDGVFKFYSAIFNKNTQELSEMLQDEYPFLGSFLSFLQALQGEKQVWAFFSYLINTFRNNVEIVVKETQHDGLSVGVQWKFESEKIHVPMGKGLSFHVSHSYKGKALIRNIGIFMEPVLHFLPFRLKMMASLAGFRERIGSFMASESENKAKRISCNIVIALLTLAALFFFLRLASCKIMYKLYRRP